MTPVVKRRAAEERSEFARGWIEFVRGWIEAKWRTCKRRKTKSAERWAGEVRV